MKKLLAVLMVAALVFCFASSAMAEEPIKLKLGLNDPNTSNYYKGALAIASEVKKATKGRIEIQVFPSGQLGNEREMVEGAMMGTVDMWSAANSVLANFIPQMKILDIAFPPVEDCQGQETFFFIGAALDEIYTRLWLQVKVE